MKDSEPIFSTSARPLCVDPALLALDPEAEVVYRAFVIEGGRHEMGRTRAGEYIKEIRTIIARQAKGFFTLEEVAKILADAHDLAAVAILKRLETAYHDGALTVRDVSTQAPKLTGSQLRSWYDWVTPDDVDKLFTGWGVTYRFPRMATESTQPALTAVPRQRAQEAAILAKLQELNFDPQAVPLPPKAGKASPAKQAVGAALGYSIDVMNKAWQRLRNEGRIKDASPRPNPLGQIGARRRVDRPND